MDNTAQDTGKDEQHLQTLITLGDNYPELMRLSLEQLRLLALLGRLGSVSQIAKRTGKDPSSVTKTVNAAENKLIHFAQEQIINRSLGRNRLAFMQPTGERILEFSETVLQQAHLLAENIREAQKADGLTIGLTTFQMPLMAQINERFIVAAERRRIKYNWELRHLNTGEIVPSLLNMDVDAVLGAHCFPAGQVRGHIHDDIDFLPYHSERLGIMGNIKLERDSISLREVMETAIPLLFPSQGAIYRFLTEATGMTAPKSLEEAFNVVMLCNDINFMIELLRLNLYEACIITTASIFAELQKLHGFEHMIFLPFNDTAHTMQHGVFYRKGERHRYHANHPFSLFMETYEALIADN